MARVHFLTFGDGSPQLRGAATRLRREALQTGIFDSADVYGLRRLRDEYLSFWKGHGHFILSAKRGLGYFLWKPFLVSAKLDEIAEDDFLVYADAGCEFMPDNRQELVDWLPAEPECDLSVVPLEPFHTNARWTNSRCLTRLEGADEFLQQPILAATFMFLKNTSRSRHFAGKWLEWSVYDDYCCLVDRPGDAERPEFEEHRHDQSIFSLLAYDLERQGALHIKRIGIERTQDGTAAIRGMRNKTPFRRGGRSERRWRLLSRSYNLAVKLFWNEQKHRADLYRSLRK
jgi:hypothetical protein